MAATGMQPKMCCWEWSDRHLVWRTTCDVELSDSDRDELLGDYYATHCPWCGGRICSEAPEDRRTEDDAEREEEAALRRDYWKAVL